MLEAGFLEEVRSLKDQGYGEADPGMQILGYRQLFKYLEGYSGWEDTVAAIKKETRNLAKRQLTWFRREKEITWLDLKESAATEGITENICKIVKDLVP
jgi:tRNA dimethylallyltransferase